MSMRLYELTGEYDRLRDLAEEAGTPEAEAAFKAALAGITDSLAEKSDRCAALMSEWQNDADDLEREEQRLFARRQAILSNRKRLAEYVLFCFEQAQIEKLKGPRYNVYIQKNAPSVKIDDEKLIPADYWRTKLEVAKDVLAAALKQGEVVPGAHLETGKSLRVR